MSALDDIAKLLQQRKDIDAKLVSMEQTLWKSFGDTYKLVCSNETFKLHSGFLCDTVGTLASDEKTRGVAMKLMPVVATSLICSGVMDEVRNALATPTPVVKTP